MNNENNAPKGLLWELEQYNLTDKVPMHMPGHKRNSGMLTCAFPWELDVTEIEPFDDLHDAGGTLANCMAEAAKLFGSKRTFYLVNGSSCGILAAICALPKKGEIIVARNCHQSVFHAVELSGHMPIIIEPRFDPDFVMYGEISAGAVLTAVQSNPNAAAVVITSPTYEGIVSDVSEIIKTLKPFGIPLVVDEAHGAHLGFDEYFPNSAVRLGADLVVQSLHKTLPALTQSALLHLNTDIISQREIVRQLRIFQTSSPSYVLMASMDYCTRELLENGNEWFANFACRLKDFYLRTKALEKLKIHRRGDPSKIVVSAEDIGLEGFELAEKLLEHGIQIEMSTERYCVLMTSICDKSEHFERLIEALFAIDKLSSVTMSRKPCAAPPGSAQVLPLRDALEKSSENTRLDLCAEKICAEYIWTYPPGVPLAIPGQRLESEIIDWIKTKRNVRSTYGGLPLSIRTLLT